MVAFASSREDGTLLYQVLYDAVGDNHAPKILVFKLGQAKEWGAAKGEQS